MAEAQESDLFKVEFKRYKKRSANLSDVVDFKRRDQHEGEVSEQPCQLLLYSIVQLQLNIDQ